jgi:hypothetical protein
MLSYLKGIVTGLVAGMYIMAAFPQWPRAMEETVVDKARALYQIDTLHAIGVALHD